MDSCVYLKNTDKFVLILPVQFLKEVCRRCRVVFPFEIKMSKEESKKKRLVRRRIPEKKKRDFRTLWEQRKGRGAPAALISVIVPFIVFIVAPFEIYCSNIAELRFALVDFLPLSVMMGIACAAVLFAILWLLPKNIYNIFSAVLAAVGLMLFVQGTYLNQGIDSLAGDNVGAGGVSTVTMVVNTIVWALVIIGAIVAAVLLTPKKEDYLRIGIILLCVTVLGTQLISCLTLSLTTEGVFLPLQERANTVVEDDEGNIRDTRVHCMTKKNITTLSRKNNVFIFCVDRFDDRYAAETFQKHPEIFEDLDGFTYFNDNISLYGHTYPAVTYMITRSELPIDGHRSEYLDSAWRNAETLKTLKKNGYSVNIYTDPYYGYNSAAAMSGVADNVIPTESNEYIVTNPLKLWGQMIRMALYRCLPMVMKDMVGDLNSSIFNNYIQYEADHPEYSSDMKNIFDTVTGTDFETVDNNVFTFLHFSGCHGVDYDAEWGDVDPSESTDITISVKNSFKIIGRYLEEMKRLGVYDDATIIITGDHAAALHDGVLIGETALKTRVTALFVKPAGAPAEELKYSSAQVSQDNLWATIMKSAGIENDLDLGRSVFEVPENETATRRYVWHKYNVTSYTECLYEIIGSARNPQNWRLVSETDMKKSLYH